MAATNTENAPQSFNSMLMVKQIILLVAMAGSVTAGWWMFDWLKEPNYGVLFTSLDNQEASLIMDELQQQNTRYKVDNSTGAILVPSADVHKIRIKLAAQGLPKGTSGGILGGEEGASGFGVSEALEKARFQKALEAELAVTITSITNVKSARVHLAIPKQSVFVRDRQKPRASIAINLYAGRQLADWQVAAIVHLVSSGVSNLETDDVTIIDQKGRLLTSGQSNSEMAMTSTQFQYTQRLEKSYARRIENILTPILGADSVRAQVTANIDFTYSEQTQETFNPDTPTVRSSQTVDEQSNGKGSGGVPGALTNQPPGQSDVPETASSNEAGSAAGKNSRSTRRETKNFELDKTIQQQLFLMMYLQLMKLALW